MTTPHQDPFEFEENPKWSRLKTKVGKLAPPKPPKLPSKLAPFFTDIKNGASSLMLTMLPSKKTTWKIFIVVIAAALLAIITQPVWRYRVWTEKSTRSVHNSYSITSFQEKRLDRLTGDIETWQGGHWQKDFSQ